MNRHFSGKNQASVCLAFPAALGASLVKADATLEKIKQRHAISVGGIAGMAGSTYGLSPWFRLSIATDSVGEAGRRIARACTQLRGEA